MLYLLRSDDAGEPGRLGGKAWALREMGLAGLPIPTWFVVTPAAFYASLTCRQREALEAASDEPGLQEIVQGVVPGADVRQELETALAQLCPDGAPVAVRSSAGDEDGTQQSFAGQLDSFLFVPPPEVPDRVAAVWRSGFGARV